MLPLYALVLSLPSLLPAIPRHGQKTCYRKRVTEDEPLTRAEANGYRMGKHREEDEVWDHNKHVEKTMKD